MMLEACVKCCVVIMLCTLISSYIIDPGPIVIPTKGGIWPKPQQLFNSSRYFILDAKKFQFEVTGENCVLLQEAIERYKKVISMDIGIEIGSGTNLSKSKLKPSALKKDPNFVGFLDKLEIRLSTPCNGVVLPEVKMNEEYILHLTHQDGHNYLTAPSIWGILRGLETFSQAIYLEKKLPTINSTHIHDFPRFSFRGLLLDTSRHYIPMDKILQTLDAMAYNKFNVFHWHITDDHSFPYVSKTFPELSAKGAYTPNRTYGSADVQRVISYAGARGIRVIPEFDTPGHTRSWGIAYPELLTPCYINGSLSGKFGPMDPTKRYTYTFLQKFFKEVLSVFPDPYIHLGADEVEFECWQSNPQINEFMKQNKLKNYTDLEDFYVDRLLDIVDDLGGSPIVWEEVFTNNITFKKSTIVHVWKDNWNGTIAKVTKAGYQALLSGGFYLDHPGWGGDWEKFYMNEPTNFTGTEEQKKLVLGGEACMWSENVNEYNIESRIWPRASAIAEKLWSAFNVELWQNASTRLEEHTCRMNRRGIGAQPPNGPGFCN